MVKTLVVAQIEKCYNFLTFPSDFTWCFLSRNVFNIAEHENTMGDFMPVYSIIHFMEVSDGSL